MNNAIKERQSNIANQDGLWRRIFLASHRALFPSRLDAWVFGSVLARLAVSFLTLTVVLRLLSTQEMAAWYLFHAVFSVAALTDAGIGKAVTRQLADMGGGRVRAASDVCNAATMLANLRPVYATVVALVCMLAFTTGYWWFVVEGKLSNISMVTIAWGVFAVASGLALYGNFLGSALSGLQRIDLVSRSEVSSAAFGLIVLFAANMFIGGLLVPAIAALSTSVLLIALTSLAIRVVAQPPSVRGSSQVRGSIAAFRTILPDASRMLLIVGAYQLLTSGFMIVLGATQRSATVASYGLTFQLTSIIVSLANTWLIAVFPQLAGCAGRPHELRKLFFPRLLRASLVSAIGMAILVVVGPRALTLLGSKTALLDLLLVLLICGIVWIEFVTGQFVQLLLSRGIFDIAYYSALSASVALLSAWWVLSAGFGLDVALLVRVAVFVLMVGIPTFLRARNILGA